MYALRHKRYRGRILPLVVEKCKVDRLSWTLDGKQMIDFTGGFDAGCEAMLATWGIRYAAAQHR